MDNDRQKATSRRKNPKRESARIPRNFIQCLNDELHLANQPRSHAQSRKRQRRSSTAGKTAMNESNATVDKTKNAPGKYTETVRPIEENTVVDVVNEPRTDTEAADETRCHPEGCNEERGGSLEEPSSSNQNTLIEETKSRPTQFVDLCVYIVPLGNKVTRVQRNIWCQQLTRLGARVSDTIDSDVTHIVVDNTVGVERIRQFFENKLQDKEGVRSVIVTVDWIVYSLAERSPLSEETFILEGYSLKPRTQHQNKSPWKPEAGNFCSSSTTGDFQDVNSPSSTHASISAPLRESNSTSDQQSKDPHQVVIPDRMLKVRQAFACVQSGDKLLQQKLYNDRIVAKIEECADILGASADSENIWREYQYKKAASMLRNLPYPVDFGNVKQLTKKKGIGQRMVGKIEEILRRGTFRKLEILKNQSSTKTMQDLTGIWGIGPKTAQRISSKGIKSSAELANHLNLSDLSSSVNPQPLSRIQEQLAFTAWQLDKARELGISTRALQGLSFYTDLLQRIPREEVAEIEREIRCTAARLWDGVTAICCGSYRRCKKSSGDVDVIVTHDDGVFRHLSGLIEVLEQLGVLNVHLQMPHERRMGKSKKLIESDEDVISETYMGIGRPIFPVWRVQREVWIGQRKCPQSPFHRLPDSAILRILRFASSPIFRRIDLKSYRRDIFAFALLYFTGSDHFNRSMRAYAKRCGLTLTDSGLHVAERFKGEKWWVGRTLTCQTEQEIFEALKLPYKSPEERNCYNEDVLEHEEPEQEPSEDSPG